MMALLHFDGFEDGDFTLGRLAPSEHPDSGFWQPYGRPEIKEGFRSSKEWAAGEVVAVHDAAVDCTYHVLMPAGRHSLSVRRVDGQLRFEVDEEPWAAVTRTTQA